MKKYLYLIATTLFVTSGCTDMQHNDPSAILDTTWNLVELDNTQIQHPGPHIPHIRFEADRVTGYDGCNNFFGDYTRNENNFKFGLLASTRMVCPHINDFDLLFNKMLSITSNYRITGNRLALYAEDKLLASFLAAVQN